MLTDSCAWGREDENKPSNCDFPLSPQKRMRQEGSPSFRIQLFSPLQLCPPKWGRYKWNVLEILWKFLYISIYKNLHSFFFFKFLFFCVFFFFRFSFCCCFSVFLNVTQSCLSLTLPVLFPLRCFLLPAATYHFIRMPGDRFHTMPADVIFLDAHTVHHLDSRWQGDRRVTL